MQRKFIKSYGNKVKLVLEIGYDNRYIIKSSTVFYKTNVYAYWKEHLSLGFIMGNKSVSSSTCFSGGDWELLENIAHAQSEAFYAHGENVDTLLIDDLREEK